MLEKLLDGMRDFLLKKDNTQMQRMIDDIRVLLDYDTAKVAQVSDQFSMGRTFFWLEKFELIENRYGDFFWLLNKFFWEDEGLKIIFVVDQNY